MIGPEAAVYGAAGRQERANIERQTESRTAKACNRFCLTVIVKSRQGKDSALSLK